MPIWWVVLGRSRHHKHKEQHMPRFQNTGKAAEEWAERLQEPGHMVDLCNACSSDVEERDGRYPTWVRLENDEPKGTLERADWHPDYAEVDYRCDFCSATLGKEDNDEDEREQRCGWSLTGCTGVGTIRVETPRGDLIMSVCESCNAADNGSVY